jgi:Erythromycin esterase
MLDSTRVSSHRWSQIAIVLALAAALAQPLLAKPRPKPPKPPAGFPILPGIYRLDGSDPSLPTADLQPLKQILGNTPIVALGESVHTSGGYYEMKHRLVRFLVQEMGFRVFAIESPWPGADQAAAYVETCDGSPEDAIRGLFGVWQSAETRDMVQWMCEWNSSHRKAKDRVHFYGFDVQQPDYDGPALLAFLERIGIGSSDPIAEGIRQCDSVTHPLAVAFVPEDKYQQCLAALDAVDALFARDEQSIVRQTSRWDFEWARISLVGVRAWEGQMYYYQGTGRDRTLANQRRDVGMAYVLQTIRRLRYPNQKTIVWAHNAHIGKDTPYSYYAKNMGAYLRESLGANYAAVALVSFQADIDWPGVGCGPISNLLSGPNAVETLLHNLGADFALADLSFPGTDQPFLRPGGAYSLGGSAMVPRDQFNAVVYLGHSRKMSPLRWPSCM